MLSAELRGTAIVTGGGRGIGANIARELARAGMDVVVTGRTAEEVRAVTEEIGGRALVGDVSKREDVARWCGDVGAVDLLVSNAGISGPEDPLGDIDAWCHTFEVNVLGTYMCCRAFAPLMIERGGGRIVNVASGSAYLPPRDGSSSTAYPASKAAVHRFSEVLAASLAPQNVFVFSISPGLVRTSMTAWLGDDAPT
jgi:NAD(P)-dependent dehydrogenase (short-subunit alcohol dehydrogenase family)